MKTRDPKLTIFPVPLPAVRSAEYTETRKERLTVAVKAAELPCANSGVFSQEFVTPLGGPYPSPTETRLYYHPLYREYLHR